MNNSRDFKFSTKEYSTAQNFKHVSPMLSKQPILYCCVVHFIFYPLWEDLIELISFSQTPHAPAPGGWCSHQIFSVSRYCAGCLVIVCDGVAYTRWLQPGRARQLAPLSPKTVARCAGVVTQRKWALETPDLGSRVPWSPWSPHHGQCENIILPARLKSISVTQKTVNRHLLRWMNRHEDLL